MIKEIFGFIWGKIPWWGKWPVVILATPTFLFISFLTWHSNSIHATIRPYKEKRDIEIKHMDKKLDSIDRKLDILILRTR